jgi:hypothetical protein
LSVEIKTIHSAAPLQVFLFRRPADIDTLPYEGATVRALQGDTGVAGLPDRELLHTPVLDRVIELVLTGPSRMTPRG